MGFSDPANVTYPSGSVAINPATCEISGSNPERQDFIIGPNPAERFSGYFVARFDTPFIAFGTVQNGTVRAGETARDGKVLGGYVTFRRDTQIVNVRIGVSFISVEQARRNLESEIPDGTRLEQTARRTRTEWAEKLDRVRVEGGSQEQLETFYTALFHTLQALALLVLWGLHFTDTLDAVSI
jgi:putative alpha-1,2-mannosidase